MKQLGNLAIICARRRNVLLQVLNGPEKRMMQAPWDNDEEISTIIHELNFGKYKEVS